MQAENVVALLREARDPGEMFDVLETILERETDADVSVTRHATGTEQVLIAENGSDINETNAHRLDIITSLPAGAANTPPFGIKFKNDAISGTNAFKAAILLGLLDLLATTEARCIFYPGQASPVSLETILAEIIPEDMAVIVAEPTRMYVCPVERGNGRSKLSFKLNNPFDARVLPDIARTIEERFTPAHPLYPLDPKLPYSLRFLPGASMVRAFVDERAACIHVSFTHQPFNDRYQDTLHERVINIANDMAPELRSDVKDEWHYPGARFSPSSKLVRAFDDATEAATGQRAYLEWSSHPTAASVLYSISPMLPCAVYGLGDPFTAGSKGEKVSMNEVHEFSSRLKAVSECLPI